MEHNYSWDQQLVDDAKRRLKEEYDPNNKDQGIDPFDWLLATDWANHLDSLLRKQMAAELTTEPTSRESFDE